MKKSPRPSAREVFAKNLRRSRRMQDISQEELADRADMSRSYLSGVERGVRNISIDNMGLLAEALGVRLMDLVDQDLFAQPERASQDHIQRPSR